MSAASRSIACTSVVLCLLFQSAPAQSATDELYRFGYDPRPDFVLFDPHYRQVHDPFSKELDALQADMIRQQRTGRKTFCTRQVFLNSSS